MKLKFHVAKFFIRSKTPFFSFANNPSYNLSAVRQGKQSAFILQLSFAS